MYDIKKQLIKSIKKAKEVTIVETVSQQVTMRNKTMELLPMNSYF